MSGAACIVQARMKSSRLPGKVMLKIAGKTILERVLERCKGIAGIDHVICATVADATCDPVAKEAERLGVEVFRGSEEDVLDRYWRAALPVKADRILRVTSDCPLVDPQVCGDVLALLQSDTADFAVNNMPPSWPHGLDCEAFSFAWLDRAAHEAKLPSEREHVGPFMRNHADSRKANLACPQPDLARHRWTLDTDEDLRFMRTLLPHLIDGPTGWGWRETLRVLSSAPEIALINAGSVSR